MERTEGNVHSQTSPSFSLPFAIAAGREMADAIHAQPPAASTREGTRSARHDADWFRPSPWRQLQMSPDGRQVGALQVGRVTNRWVQWQPGLNSDPVRSSFLAGPFIEFAWLGQDHAVLHRADSGGSACWEWFGAGVWSPLEPPPKQAWVRLLRPSPWTPSSVLIEGFDRSSPRRSGRGRWLDVFEVSPTGSPPIRRATNPGDVVEWLADGTGRVRLALAIRGQNQELRVSRAAEGGADWTTMHTFDFLTDPARLLAMSSDGSRAWLAARLGRNTRGMFEIDVPGRRFRREVWGNPDFDFDGSVVADGHDLVAVNYQAERPVTAWLDTNWRDSAPGRSGWSPMGLSRDGRFGVFQENSPPGFGRFWWADRERGVTRELLLPDEPMRPLVNASLRQPIQWRARDGMPLSGYLTRPASAGTNEKPPLVVLVHGGPWTRDTWGGAPEVPFLASRGWAVLQVNYRGSAGFGREFQEAGAGNWNRAVDDLEDGVRWVVENVGVDGDRVGVAGASFGGFLAGLAVTRESTPFVAAASLGGVFDLRAWLNERRRHEPEYVLAAQRYGLLGGPADPTSLRVQAAQIRRPLVLVHAQDDPMVDFQHSARMARELRERDRPVTFLPRVTGGHGLGTPEDQAEVWSEVELFLKRFVK